MKLISNYYQYNLQLNLEGIEMINILIKGSSELKVNTLL